MATGKNDVTELRYARRKDGRLHLLRPGDKGYETAEIRVKLEQLTLELT